MQLLQALVSTGLEKLELDKYMKEEEIRKIVQDEIQKNYRLGNTQVPPHQHNGVDNLIISSSNIGGFVPIPSGNIKYKDDNGVSAFGFASEQLLQSPAFTLQGNTTSLYPLPVIYSNSATGFRGGYAPEGTVILFIDPTITGQAQLWSLIQGTWYGVNLSTAP